MRHGNSDNQVILVLDFGGQYKELIARKVRELSVYSQIRSGDISADELQSLNPKGIIITGGPNSVYLPSSPKCDRDILELGIPILGICYGMHMLCHMLGGEVASTAKGEYGRVEVNPAVESGLLGDGGTPFFALMSHRDAVTRLPDGFSPTACTADCAVAAFENPQRKIYGTQFHPESAHTDCGHDIIKRFLYDICGVDGDYLLDDYINTKLRQIRQSVWGKRILLGLSGGVDSSVCAALLSKAVPDQLICIFVDHGLMRLGEGDEIERIFSKRRLRFIRVNAQKRFLEKLKGVVEPETKRKLIGEEFVKVFGEEAKRLGNIPLLAQGTIYPDIVESGGKYGATIKSHHNVGGLPEKLPFDGVVEPLSGLFKDEVREVGKKLRLPASLVNRQPFPGPGLAVRIMGEVTEEKLEVLRRADHILCDGLSQLRQKPQQYFTVLTDTYSVGVKGDERTYDPVIAIRAVTTSDFMTCEYYQMPHKVLKRISARITSEIPTVSRVVYDVTSKPPATVEWE